MINLENLFKQKLMAVNLNERIKVDNGEEVEGYNSKEEAEEDGWAFVKKAQLVNFKDNLEEIKESSGIEEQSRNEGVLWSVYSFDNKGGKSEWIRVITEDQNRYVDSLYDLIYGNDEEKKNSEDENTGVFYQLEQTHNVSQMEDAQRGPTNPLVKYLFKYRKYYIYDGTDSRGVEIERDRQRVLYGYLGYKSIFNGESDTTNKNHYDDKVLFDESKFSDIENFEVEASCADNGCNNFYHYKTLVCICQ